MKLRIVKDCTNSDLLNQIIDNAKEKAKTNKDETLIKVCRFSGEDAGVFFWPTKDLSMIVELNKAREGYLLRYDGIDFREISVNWPLKI